MAERSLESMVDHLHRVAAERDDSVSDGVLLTRFVQFRDPAAFELIVWRHGAMVQAVCRRVLGRNGDIDDAFQATFLVLLRYARSIRRRDSLAAWLHSVALRVARRCMRTLAAQQRIERRASKPELEVPADHDYSDVGPILHAEIELLPERLRKPFILCEIEGRTDAEAAAILAIPYGTVISRLSRARERLRRRLVKRGVVLGSVGLASLLAEKPASAELVASAVQGVLQGDSGTSSATILAKGVVHTMFIRKAKLTIAATLAALVVGGVGLTTLSRQIHTANAAERVPPGEPAKPQAANNRPANVQAPDDPANDQPDKPKAAKDQSPAKPLEVEIALPSVRTVTDYLEFTGCLQAFSTVSLRPRVTGTLSTVTFRDGAEVQKGQVLFEIDSIKYRTELEKARSALVAAEAGFSQADADLKRLTALRASSAVDQATVDKASADRTAAGAQIRRAKADEEMARHNLELTQVVAPISGQIGRHLVDPGNVVKADETALAEIVNGNPMYVYCDVDEGSLGQIRALESKSRLNAKKLSVGVGLPGEEGFPHPGEVDFIDNHVNQTNGTISVRIVLANKDNQMLPGMFARVRFQTGEPHQALLIPQNVLVSDGKKRYVYVLGANNTIELRTVELGQTRDGHLAVTSGLKAEDRVVILSHPEKLHSGMIVQPKSKSDSNPEQNWPKEKR